MAEGFGARSTTEGVSSGLNLGGKRILGTPVLVDGKELEPNRNRVEHFAPNDCAPEEAFRTTGVSWPGPQT